MFDQSNRRKLLGFRGSCMNSVRILWPVLDGTVEDKAVQDNTIQEGAGQSSADSAVRY